MTDKPPLTNQQKIDSLLSYLAELRPQIAEMRQTLLSSLAWPKQLTEEQKADLKSLIAEALEEKIAALGQDRPHQHGGDPQCQECLEVARQSIQRHQTQAITETSRYYEGIPGVAELRQVYERMKAEGKDPAAELIIIEG